MYMIDRRYKKADKNYRIVFVVLGREERERGYRRREDSKGAALSSPGF